MNYTHFDHVIANYLEKFELMNNEIHDETYKWKIAKKFKPMMDAALAGADEELPQALYNIRLLTQNLIDSITQPLTGLSYFARFEPQTVRKMFLDLFADDENDLTLRMKKINAFLDAEDELREKHAQGSWMYRNSVHSITCYQTFYDPDNHYILKPSNCREFANCIEFYDSWDSGRSTKLDVFYRMCDQTAKYLESNEALMAAHNSRYEMFPADSLHPDLKHHILVFDFIYCCSSPTYALYHGVTFNPVPSAKERTWREEQHKKAEAAEVNLRRAREEADLLSAIKNRLSEAFSAGTKVAAKQYGNGTITDMSVDPKHIMITAIFPDAGERKMNLMTVLANGLLTTEDEEVMRFVQENKALIKKSGAGAIATNTVFNNLLAAEREYEKYEEYLA